MFRDSRIVRRQSGVRERRAPVGLPIQRGLHAKNRRERRLLRVRETAANGEDRSEFGERYRAREETSRGRDAFEEKIGTQREEEKEVTREARIKSRGRGGELEKGVGEKEEEKEHGFSTRRVIDYCEKIELDK